MLVNKDYHYTTN